MKIYVTSAGTKKDIESVHELKLGVLISTDAAIRHYMKDVPVVLDNGAWRAWTNRHGFDEYAFLRTLHNCLSKDIRPQWIVTPDIVAGGIDSLEFSLYWRKRLQGHPQYLAVQDGIEPQDVKPHIHLFQGIFVGGTMKWKLRTAHLWTSFAHLNGKQCHVGRIGTVNRLIWATEIGADSVDSSSFTRNGTIHYCSDYLKEMQECPALPF